jgi:uncharacterized protein (TIGR02246 family)
MPIEQSSPFPGDEQIQRLIADHVAAWNMHDARAYSQTYAEDADFRSVRGIAAHGRNAIEEFHASRFDTLFRTSHLTASDVWTRVITPTIASVDVRWEMTGATGHDGKPIPFRSGLMNCVVTKTNGEWLITVGHNQEFAPPAKE